MTAAHLGPGSRRAALGLVPGLLCFVGLGWVRVISQGCLEGPRGLTASRRDKGEAAGGGCGAGPSGSRVGSNEA